MAELDRVLRLDGYDNKTIRGHIVSEMTKVQSDADFETLMNTPMVLTDKHSKSSTHRKQQNFVLTENSYLQRGVQADEMDRKHRTVRH